MICPQCGSPHCSVEFTDDGLINACAECEAQWKNKGDFTIEQNEAPAQQSQPKRIAQPINRASNANPVTPRTLVRQARARIVELDREIKRLSRLTQERDELKRLLAAAKHSGEATNVRPLRAASRG